MTPMMEPTTIFRKRSDARYRNIGGEGIVVKQAAGEVLVLSEVGARVLDLVETQTPVGAMLASLGEEYDIDSSTLERDVNGYLEQLLEAGIIERAN